MNKRHAVLVMAYLLTIPAGVGAIERLGVVPIPGGYMAPAAVYVVGLTLVLRDIVHEQSGWKVAAGAVVAGAGLSAIFNPALALASGVAFLLSETLDLAVYERIRSRVRHAPLGILASNAVSIPVDSVVFLGLAFGSMAYLPGQVIGKSIATLVAVAAIVALRLRRVA